MCQPAIYNSQHSAAGIHGSEHSCGSSSAVFPKSHEATRATEMLSDLPRGTEPAFQSRQLAPGAPGFMLYLPFHNGHSTHVCWMNESQWHLQGRLPVFSLSKISDWLPLSLTLLSSPTGAGKRTCPFKENSLLLAVSRESPHGHPTEVHPQPSSHFFLRKQILTALYFQ